MTRCAANEGSGAQDIDQFLEPAVVRVMLSQIGTRLQHRIPIRLAVLDYIQQELANVLARHQGKSSFPINLANCTFGKHQNRNRICAEGFKRPIRDETKLLKERPVKYRAKFCLAQKVVYLVERDGLPSLDATSSKQLG